MTASQEHTDFTPLEINEAYMKLFYKDPFRIPWRYLLFWLNVMLWAVGFWAFVVICFSYEGK